MKPSEQLINTVKVEKDFLHYLKWFYRYDASDEIERVIKICDDQPSHDFERAWCDFEDQELVWMFIDLFALDLRSLLTELVLQKRKEEEESAQESIDRINDLRGIK